MGVLNVLGGTSQTTTNNCIAVFEFISATVGWLQNIGTELIYTRPGGIYTWTACSGGVSVSCAGSVGQLYYVASHDATKTAKIKYDPTILKPISTEGNIIIES